MVAVEIGQQRRLQHRSLPEREHRGQGVAGPLGGLVRVEAPVLGRPGIAIGPVLFLLIANPISGAAMPKEFLPSPWGDVGQWLPPGAGATLVRDLSYFPEADTAFPWLVLGGWATAGLLLAMAGHFLLAGRRAGAVADDVEHAV